MQLKKATALSLLVTLVMLLIFSVPFARAEGSIDIADMMGRAVHLDAPAARIVALTASDVEILYALGAGDKLVGRGAYCDYPAEVSSVPVVQSGAETNYEEIIALQPQVVLMNTMAQTIEQSELLTAAGITVVVSNAADIAGTYESIRLIGAVAGKSVEAETLVADMQSAFAEVAAKAAGDLSKSVYFEVSPLEWGLWTAGSGTFMNELAAMVGVRNAFEDVQGWGEISEEQVLARDPDYIVTVGMYFGQGLTPVEEILSRESWLGLKAVKNGGVFNANSDEISRPGPRLMDAVWALYDFIYGADELAPAA
ncbi:ABC transporter substrate-binding protein [Clostridia bacterium]|nr:ABC transporter substrate-binding protein [Clostridia bacterium]